MPTVISTVKEVRVSALPAEPPPGGVRIFCLTARKRFGDPDLCDRFAMHNLDILLWVSPKAAARQTLLKMMEGGVSVVVVNDGKGSFPRSQYMLDAARAIRVAMQDWMDNGVKRVQVWFSPEKWDGPAGRCKKTGRQRKSRANRSGVASFTAWPN
jgi:hypothetical protein